MIGKRGQKAALMDWANDQNQLDRTAKYTLKELASYADADCCAWAKVATLAYGVNCSERTLQYQLRALQEAGLIRDTGRTHRLEGSTRSVPIYQLAPDADGLGRAGPMGAVSAPILGDGCKTGGGMGAIGLHPQETIGDQELADASSPGASAREIAFRDLVDASPKPVLKFADLAAAFAAFCVLADQGVEVGRLAECARRMGEDPAFRSRRFPDPLEAWLSKGQFLGWWPSARADEAVPQPSFAAADANAAPAADQAVWREVDAKACAGMGEGDYGSYIRRCFLGLAGSELYVVAWSGVARDWIAGRCWKRLTGWWAEADPAGRPLKLVSKNEFAALAQRQGEGVGS